MIRGFFGTRIRTFGLRKDVGVRDVWRLVRVIKSFDSRCNHLSSIFWCPSCYIFALPSGGAVGARRRSKDEDNAMWIVRECIPRDLLFLPKEEILSYLR